MSSTAYLLTVHNHLNSTSFSGRSPCHPFILPAPQWPQTQSQEEWLCPTPVPSARAQLRAAAAREDWWGSAQPCQAEGPGGAPVAAGKGGAASCVQQDGGATIWRDATKPGQGCASAQVHFYTYRNTRAHTHTHKCEDAWSATPRQHKAAWGPLSTNTTLPSRAPATHLVYHLCHSTPMWQVVPLLLWRECRRGKRGTRKVILGVNAPWTSLGAAGRSPHTPLGSGVVTRR